MQPKDLPAYATPLDAVNAGIAEADRRGRGNFDGLLGGFDPASSRLLRDMLSYLRDYLLDRYTDEEARALLATFEPVEGYRNMPVIDDDVELAVNLLNMIRSASRCKGERLEILIFGPRDSARQAGVHKPRGSRMPELDAYIADQLGTNPKATASEIWQSVPCARDDFARAGIYRDGGKVVEYHNERERATARSGFEKRVTRARKSRKPR